MSGIVARLTYLARSVNETVHFFTCTGVIPFRRQQRHPPERKCHRGTPNRGLNALERQMIDLNDHLD